jgi:hypothetical protein
MVRKMYPTKGFSEQGQREAGFSLDNYSNKRKHGWQDQKQIRSQGIRNKFGVLTE